MGVTVQRVHQLIKDGSLRAQKIGRDYVINEADLESVTHRRPVGRPPKTSTISPTGKPKTVRKESDAQAIGKSSGRK